MSYLSDELEPAPLASPTITYRLLKPTADDWRRLGVDEPSEALLAGDAQAILDATRGLLA